MKSLKLLLCFLFLLFLSTSLAIGKTLEIRILHINDFHGFAEPYKPIGSDEMLGGIAYLSESLDKLRKEKPSILLSAGDMIQGNNWSNLSRGESVIELMNIMVFDAMVLGNHEFDFGKEILKKRILEARFPILGANVNGLDILRPYVVKEFNGVKIAIIGVVTEDTPISTHPKNVIDIKFESPEETVKKYVDELRDKTDIIVVLSHIGFHADRVLAEKVNGIDIIIGGHSHTKIDNPVIVGKTIITQAWEHAKALGVLDITLEDKKIIKFNGYLEEIKPSFIKKDVSVSLIVNKYKQKVDRALNEKIGYADTDLDGENVRKRETNLGNLISDIMRQVSGADVAIINGGGIRTSIKKGEVRVKDVYSALPFDNYIVAIKLKGIQIRWALEHGVSSMEEGSGRFPQVSGITFRYSRFSKSGLKIKEIFISGKPIESDKEYVVATNDFLVAGGDGYKIFGDALKESNNFSIVGGMIKSDKIVYNDSGRQLSDLVIEYIKNRKRISPSVEGRIREI
jgi:2',3'-cyclic-nucleotide 2'-phosphodiesterase (5'-nucleotidase family)